MSDESADRLTRTLKWVNCNILDHLVVEDSVEGVYGHVRKIRMECHVCGKELQTVVE